MRFLGVLRLGRIETRLFRQVAVAELVGNRLARGLDRFRRHLHAVGTHIGDQTDRLAADVDAFIELLRDLHGARCGEAEFGGGGLLQC
ncbi:hypothetical protein D9M70_423560 [compost metagenome]